MTNLVIGLLTAVLSTNQPVAVSNLVKDATGVSVSITDPKDTAQVELDRLMLEDNAATAEVDKWIRENIAFKAKGAGESRESLNTRIIARFDVVRKGYTNLLGKFPKDERVMLAYGSFLTDIGLEDQSIDWYEKARQTNPKNPAAWNQAANYYGHNSPVVKSFEYYQKAIELDPTEVVYYRNLATTVYLFRMDATNYYHINEQQVFDKALSIYQQAEKLDSNNFELAQDVAQTYYGIKPLRGEEALKAWTNALSLATTDVEREGVHIHFARVKMALDRFDESRQHLNLVSLPYYEELKTRLSRNLNERIHPTSTTNIVPDMPSGLSPKTNEATITAPKTL